MLITRLTKNQATLAQQLYILFQESDQVQHPSCPPFEHTRKMLEHNNYHVIVAIDQNQAIGSLVAL